MTPLNTDKAAADYLGVSRQTINKAKQGGSFPKKGPKGWQPSDLDAWKASRRTDGGLRAASTSAASPEDMLLAKQRKILADAIRAENEAELAAVKLARVRGEIVMRVSVDQLLRTIASRQKQVLIALKSELLPKLRALTASQWEAEADEFTDRMCREMQKLVAGWKPEAEEEA
jgi:predicted DNA-binding transcriptional regulator AlpA